MCPYLNLGVFSLATYGLAVAVGLACAWLLLRVNLARHQMPASRADTQLLVVTLAGLAGAKLYHELQTPFQLLEHPFRFFSSNGFAWSGGFLAAIVALSVLAHIKGMSALTLLDLNSPSASIGYGIGRLGCLLSGDGDYGVSTSLPWGMSFPHGTVPTFTQVHPTPVYESIGAMLILWYLWRVGGRAAAPGTIVARYLILSGIARFLVEFIRINPRSCLGLTEAQAISAGCIMAGTVLLLYPKFSRRMEPVLTTQV